MNNYRFMKILPANEIEGSTPGSAGRLTGFNKGWYNQGNLPHYDQGRIFQAITYRLSDSLPQEYLKTLQTELETHDSNDMEKEHRKEIELLLDRGYGSCVLKNKECAKIVEENWQHFDGIRYKLISYVIMPNHVHILINLYQGFELGKVVKSWKSYSAKGINDFIEKAGIANEFVVKAGQTTGAPRMIGARLWQGGYWDRYVRDERHFYKTIDYIKKNFSNGGVVLR